MIRNFYREDKACVDVNGTLLGLHDISSYTLSFLHIGQRRDRRSSRFPESQRTPVLELFLFSKTSSNLTMIREVKSLLKQLERVNISIKIWIVLVSLFIERTICREGSVIRDNATF